MSCSVIALSRSSRSGTVFMTFFSLRTRRSLRLNSSSPTNLRVQPMQHARKRYRLAHMLQAADPGLRSLYAHAKAGVSHAAVLAEIKVPLEGFFGQIVLVNPLHQQFVRGRALRPSDDFAVAFGG